MRQEHFEMKRKRGSLLNAVMTVELVVFLAVLPFHLVVKRLVPGPIGTYWKEMLLGFLVVTWAIRCLQEHQLLLTNTPLDWAVIAYVGLLVLRFVLDRSVLMGPSTELRMSAWGLYVSAMYAPLFWLVPTVLARRSPQVPSGDSRRRPGERPGWALGLIALLVGVGALVALGGLFEFVLDVALWPSKELLQRHGFADMYIYGSRVRRVYFTFDSPTTLANTLGMLLPLALALVVSEAVVARRVWLRLAAGVAAALMAGCIVVTFSRGIWVASVFSLTTMGLLSGVVDKGSSRDGFVRQNWRGLLIAGGALVLIALAWILVTVLRPGRAAPTSRGVVELSPSAYEAAPVTDVTQELLHVEPMHGEFITQTWTLPDPVAGGEDTRRVVYGHPPESGKMELIHRVTVPDAGALRFAIALSPEVWSPEKGDGATFKIYVAPIDGPEEGQFAFVRYINPKHNPNDRRWRNFLVDLSSWAGRTVNVSLITTAGPADDWAFDWAGWAEPQVVGVEPGYFASAQAENVVLRHTRSILDWARDATNRDRLAAWSLAFDAWREAPLWGKGLGSTGVAALRTRPEQAFVTESQVLKALVELGLPGLLAWAFLWFQTARVGLRAYRTAEGPIRSLLLGVLISLLVIFIEGWVYQNLEVKQVNAYFWTMVGTLAFLARDSRNG